MPGVLQALMLGSLEARRAEAGERAERRRSAWFEAYVQTVVEREAPGIAASPRTADLPRLLRLGFRADFKGLCNLTIEC